MCLSQKEKHSVVDCTESKLINTDTHVVYIQNLEVKSVKSLLIQIIHKFCLYQERDQNM